MTLGRQIGEPLSLLDAVDFPLIDRALAPQCDAGAAPMRT
jgi:hypothetical protein